jgi:group I intron endonuclease
MTTGVYLVKCLSNGRSYVGSSRNIEGRWKEHRYDLRHDQHHNRHWQNAWNKYGASDFVWSVLEETAREDSVLREREQHWIDILRPEFNISAYSGPTRLGAHNTPEHKAKMSKTMKAIHAARNPDEKEELAEAIKQGMARMSEDEKVAWHARATASNKVVNVRKKEAHKQAVRARLSEAAKKRYAVHNAEKEKERALWELGKDEREQERRKKLSIANSGKRVTEEQKAKIREGALKNWADPEYRERHQKATREAMQDPEVIKRLSEAHKGKVLSAEHRAKIGNAGRGKKRSEETRQKMSDGLKAAWKRRKSKK